MLGKNLHGHPQFRDTGFAEQVGYHRSRHVDAIEHIADVVEDAGRDFRHAGLSRNFDELRVRGLEIGFDPLAFGDIDEDHDGAVDLTIVAAKGVAVYSTGKLVPSLRQNSSSFTR